MFGKIKLSMVSFRLVGLRYVVLGSVCFSLVLLSFVLLRYVISTSPPGMLRHFLYSSFIPFQIIVVYLHLSTSTHLSLKSSALLWCLHYHG